MAKSKNSGSGCFGIAAFLFLIFFNVYMEEVQIPQEEKVREFRALTLSQQLETYSEAQLIQMLGEQGFSKRTDTDSGRNLLHVACELNRPRFAKKLIDSGFSIEHPDKRNNTPIMLALFYNSRECVELLMKYQPNLNLRSRGQNMPIHSAAKYGYIDVVKESLRQGVNIEVNDAGGFSPLHLAARFQQMEMVVFLIENGADPSSSNGYGWTVGDTSFGKNHEIALYVQNKGGRLSHGQLIQEFSLRDGWPLPGLKQMETDTESSEKVLFEAVANRDNETLEKAAADLQRDFDACSRSGTPLLSFALIKKNFAAAEIILARAKNLDQRDKAGRSPLIHAIIADDENLALQILQRKADPNHRDTTGNTPLHYAVKNWKNRLVPALIQSGAEVFAVNLLQQGPLHLAVEVENLQIIEFLIQNGCDVNLEDARGNTALHLAAKSGSKDIVNRLLTNGADPYHKNLAGSVALDLVPADSTEVAALLRYRSEIEGTNPVLKAPAEINLSLPKVAAPRAEKE